MNIIKRPVSTRYKGHFLIFGSSPSTKWATRQNFLLLEVEHRVHPHDNTQPVLWLLFPEWLLVRLWAPSRSGAAAAHLRVRAQESGWTDKRDLGQMTPSSPLRFPICQMEATGLKWVNIALKCLRSTGCQVLTPCGLWSTPELEGELNAEKQQHSPFPWWCGRVFFTGDDGWQQTVL